MWQAEAMPDASRFEFYGPPSVEGPARPLFPGGPMFPSVAEQIFSDIDNEEIAVTLKLRVIDGRPTLVGVMVGPIHPAIDDREIPPSYLRSLPIKDLYDRATYRAGAAFADARTGPGHEDPATEGAAAVRAARLRRHAMTDDLLREVADVVLSDTSGKPREAVRDHFFTSWRTASRWIAATRERFPEQFIDEGGN